MIDDLQSFITAPVRVGVASVWRVDVVLRIKPRWRGVAVSRVGGVSVLRVDVVLRIKPRWRGVAVSRVAACRCGFPKVSRRVGVVFPKVLRCRVSAVCRCCGIACRGVSMWCSKPRCCGVACRGVSMWVSQGVGACRWCVGVACRCGFPKVSVSMWCSKPRCRAWVCTSRHDARGFG